MMEEGRRKQRKKKNRAGWFCRERKESGLPK
jgi:hypothetical protein